MFGNYLNTLLRALRKNRLTAFINILGLAISLAACLIIALVIQKELSFDRSHPDAERIYRVTEIISSESFTENSSSLAYPVMEAIYTDYPDMIESYVRIMDFQIPNKSFLLENNEKFIENHVYYADSNLFHFWDIPLIKGNPDDVITRPFTAVISEETAAKFFGEEDPVGKIVKLGGQDRLAIEITGLMGEGGPSHFMPNMVISLKTAEMLNRFMTRTWVWNPVWTYLKLNPGFEKDDLESKFPDFVQKYYPERLKPMVAQFLQPVTDIHLHSKLEFEMRQNGDIKYVYIFFCSALFLLIIACINFINLTTVNLSSRVKEIGMRKVVGASRKQLIMQFLFESVLTTIIAFVLALFLLLAAYPILSGSIGLDLEFERILNVEFLVIILGILTVTGLLSGFYPAYVLSGTDVVSVFKGGLKGSPKAKLFRKGLVIFQFAIASILIVFTLISNKQLNFMLTNDNGYTSDNIFVIPINHTRIIPELDAFKNQLKASPFIKEVTIMNEILGVNNNNHEFNHDGLQRDDWQYFPALVVDEDFLKSFEINLIVGRDYDRTKTREDSLSIIVNRALTRSLGYVNPQDAIGKRFQSIDGANEKIIGVTEDFNYKSLHHPVGPFALDLENRLAGRFQFFAKNSAVKVTEINPEVIQHMENVWTEFVPNKPFNYSLLSDDLDVLYKGEERMSVIVAIFSGLAILIACMGLFALSWFIAGQKTREIAIRKTMGAGMFNLLVVATKEQVLLVLFSFLISFPVSFFLISKWLEIFAFRVDQGAIPYLVSALFSIGIAVLTMIYVALKTASSDPVKVLKYE